MNRNNWLIPAACSFVLFGCASWQQADTNQSAVDAEVTESKSTPMVTTPVPVEDAPAAKPKSAVISPVPKIIVRAVKSADGLIDGEIVGTPASNSKFAKLQIGMTQAQVESLIGQPESTDSHVTGKQFQPFYFGGDTQRMEAFYKNEGQLTFSNMLMDNAADTLIRILIDPRASGSR